MTVIEKGIEVHVPVRTAYNQWTQFESFPEFMEGVESVTQLDDARLHWVTEIGGQQREFYAQITEQLPDQRIAWRAEGDTGHSGVVTFHRIDDDTCKVMVQMEHYPGDLTEKVADFFGIVDRRVKRDLERFKQFIEERGQETGAWRGTIEQRKIG